MIPTAGSDPEATQDPNVGSLEQAVTFRKMRETMEIFLFLELEQITSRPRISHLEAAMSCGQEIIYTVPKPSSPRTKNVCI